MTKILLIRFSSIGDIVLTSPIIRCLKSQLKEVEIHTLTKKQYINLYASNPNVTKVHSWDVNYKKTLKSLKKERFDYIIDLHKNIRTKRVRLFLLKKSFTFPKLNFKKFVLVKFKKDILPNIHIVDRYFNAVQKLGVTNDNKGLDFFIDLDKVAFKNRFNVKEDYITVAIGGQFYTKKMPVEKLAEVLRDLPLKIVIIGGKEDKIEGEKIKELLPKQAILNTCGSFSLQESAEIVKNAKVLVTHDTGMMHIGAAFDLPIVSIWGNTVPKFGMYPYRPQHPDSYSIHEVFGLDCRPCSKIGYATCPKGHFKCMLNQNTQEIKKQILKFLAK